MLIYTMQTPLLLNILISLIKRELNIWKINIKRNGVI